MENNAAISDYPTENLPIAIIARFGEYIAFVVTDDECHIPHFHVIKNEILGRPDWGCAIKFDTLEYMDEHGSGEHLSDTVYSDLVSYLATSVPGYGNVHNMAIVDWDRNNESYPYSRYISQNQ